ncbi:MAG TPA: DUF4838 domain-containing protein [Planctomycetaceae bacterium]|jgi:hypothetical protein|nr:DUF4838 domain-containing protein [Planctomycetaceae bacterium]
MIERSRIARLLAVLCAYLLAVDVDRSRADVCLVRDGKVRAVVVTAVKPSPVAAYAVEELVTHVQKATGQRLPVAVETAVPAGYESRLFVGVSDAARKQGIDPDKLEVEDYVLRTGGNDLYIVGKELRAEQYHGTRPRYSEPWNPLSTECVHSGTLLGVYDILENSLEVRWLWPGDLGTYVPRQRTIVLAPVSKTVKPRLLYRNLGGWDLPQIYLTGSFFGKRVARNYRVGGLSKDVVTKLVFPTEEAGFEYGKAVEVYQRRHRRVTQIENPLCVLGSHVIAGIMDWWETYGKVHPEWFAMQADGKRGLKVRRAGAWTPLCVSNSQLHHWIVERAWDGGDVLTLGEADAAGESMCHCPQCQAWDGPQQEGFPEDLRLLKYTPRAMGDRYARYWKAVFDLAVRRNPNVKVGVYLYHNTLPAPLTGIKLDKQIFGEFVIYGSRDGWYPLSQEEDRWYREQWQGWHNTGMSLVYGPNYLLSGYATPNVTTWQTGRFFKFAYEHGMVGVNYRSYTFSWAAQGPMAYMHHRLLSDPELEIEKVRQEYFAAFGPAAGEVERYFDYWEDYARNRPAVRDQITDPRGALEKLKRIRGHYLAYPPSVYRPAEAMLAKALEAARKDPLPEFAQRVEFLQAGLKHALLSTHLQEFLDFDSPGAERGSAPKDPAKLKRARQAMRDLIRFRHDPKHRFVSDYISNATVEKNQIVNIEVLFGDKNGTKDPLFKDDAN